MWKYVIFSYLLFWIMVMVLGGSAAMIFNAPPIVQRIVQAFCAWAPTFAFLILFKKLKPNTNLKDYIKSFFSEKIRFDLMLIGSFAIVLSSIIPLFLISVIRQQPFTSFFSLFGYALPISVLLSLFAGPLGEELGWRGYLRNELNNKYSFIKASIFGGIIWALWHSVLWFVDVVFMGGSTGWPLVLFIISNVVVMTSIVIIMNVILQKNNHLLQSIWIHLCFNLIYVHLTNFDTLYFALITITYTITGVLFLLNYYKNIHKENKTNKPLSK
ncbi:MAG TPA: type II CAAX endopeptidase family protein [Saprospiraceae bacterium]|nr:type II CAAX endopeptidase family protein [Saprospiraceae bacterium]